jgi:hypothetical protein
VDYNWAAAYMVKNLAEVEATKQPNKFQELETKVKFVEYCLIA